ncbi:MAG: DbpA RNA binding domain-containing protein [Candidatus Xenobia bacterium]
MPGEALGAIRIEERRTVFDVKSDLSARLTRALHGHSWRGRTLKVFTV